MTVIVDYGVGNLCSLLGSLKEIGEEAVISADSTTLLSAERIILPGVADQGRDRADQDPSCRREKSAPYGLE